MTLDRTRFQVSLHPDDLVVDNSLLSTYLKCSTLAAVEHALGLKAKVQGAALVQGQVGHAAVAEWLDTGGDAAKALTLYRREHRKQVQPNLDALPAEHEDRGRLSLERTAEILAAWFEARPLASWPLVVEPGDTELPVSAELMTLKDGRRVIFVALFDALGKRRTGGRWSIDHKFRKGITDWWKGKQEDSSQFTGHKWLSREWELGIAGTYVNAIDVPYKKTGKSKCREHGVPYHDCDTRHVNHQLFPTTRSNVEVASWLATLAKVVPRWAKLKARVKTLEDIHAAEVPMEGRFNDSCTFCDLREWCRVGRPVGGRGDWFREEQWNPLAERREAL